MEDCIFCKIINKKIPSYKIYENKYVYAFLDVNPKSKGHTIVISKKHFKNLLECDDEYLKEIIIASKKIANHLKKKINASGFNIINNIGKSAGQEIFHIHFHIIPRFKNDGINFFSNKNINYNLKDFSKKNQLKE